MMYIDGRLCKPKGSLEMQQQATQYWTNVPNLHVHRLIVWARRCYMCVYKEFLHMLYGNENDRSGGVNNGTIVIDVLKVQSRLKFRGGGLGVEEYNPLFQEKATSSSAHGMATANTSSSSSKRVSPDLWSDPYDGVQYAILSDLFLYLPRFAPNIRQLVMTLPFTKYSLIDNLGRETENGFNMWATSQLLYNFRSVPASSQAQAVAALDPENVQSANLRPLQLSEYLATVGIDAEKEHFFSHSFVQLTPEELAREKQGASSSLSSSSSPLQTVADTAAARGKGKYSAAGLEAAGDPRDYDAVHSVSAYYSLPEFCSIPVNERNKNKNLERDIRLWVEQQLQARCQPERMWLPCERARTYAPFLPCPQQLKDGVAFDLAVAKGWCNFNHKAAKIEPLRSIPQPEKVFTATRQLRTSDGKPRMRLAFFFTVYADAKFVRRLLTRLYSPDHYYMFHIDPTGSSVAFETELRAMAAEFTFKEAKSNIVLAKDVAIIYGAATASILLSRAMAWFDQYATGWDYFVPLTGSDYPLVSLKSMETILGHGKKRMPFLMAWDWATSGSIQTLRTAHNESMVSAGTTGTGSREEEHVQMRAAWVEDEDVQTSLEATWKERGNKRFMGDNLMEVRAYSYAPPLTCNAAQGFYRLETRGWNGTQWLFPREGTTRNGKGRAMIRHPKRRGGKKKPANRHAATAAGGGAGDGDFGDLTSFDKKVRLWRKSDPGTSGAYDRESVRYIVGSEEGLKYYHFFKHMLLGSEEHYYVSLLYNWERTKGFVTDIASQAVWNTWLLGEWSAGLGGFRTHTHYLTLKEMSILRGLSKRGVFFGRKFGSSNGDVLAAIDEFVDEEDSKSGRMWSGFFTDAVK
jgi:hypothetical protein